MKEHSIKASDAQFIRLFRWIAGLQINSDAKLLFAPPPRFGGWRAERQSEPALSALLAFLERRPLESSIE